MIRVPFHCILSLILSFPIFFLLSQAVSTIVGVQFVFYNLWEVPVCALISSEVI